MSKSKSARMPKLYAFRSLRQLEVNTIGTLRMISNELLSILKCPVTGSPLQLVEDQLVSKVNSAIDEEELEIG